MMKIFSDETLEAYRGRNEPVKMKIFSDETMAAFGYPRCRVLKTYSPEERLAALERRVRTLERQRR